MLTKLYMDYYKKYIKYKNKYINLKNKLEGGGFKILYSDLKKYINENKSDKVKKAEEHLEKLKNIHSKALEQYEQIIQNPKSNYNIYKTSDTPQLKFNIQNYLTDNDKNIIKKAQEFYDYNISTVQPDY